MPRNGIDVPHPMSIDDAVHLFNEVWGVKLDGQEEKRHRTEFRRVQ